MKCVINFSLIALELYKHMEYEYIAVGFYVGLIHCVLLACSNPSSVAGIPQELFGEA